jgi:hypothetical protein
MPTEATQHPATVDVVMPANGVEPWIRQSLASLAAQTLMPERVIVVNDDLQDAAEIERLGRSLLGSRFVLVTSEGSGISAAINTGIRRSDAKWIARMDADDVADPLRLQRQLESVATAPAQTLGCGSQVNFINQHGHVLGFSKMPTSWSQLRANIATRSCFFHPSMLLRRSALLDNPYRSILDGAEDLDLWIRLGRQGELFNLDDVLVDCRFHTGSRSFEQRPRQTAAQELIFRIARIHHGTGMDPLDAQPDLATRFIAWRLGQPGYQRSRRLLTACRYMLMYSRGRDMRNPLSGLRHCAANLPCRPAELGTVLRVVRNSPYDLVFDESPFPELNPRRG